MLDDRGQVAPVDAAVQEIRPVCIQLKDVPIPDVSGYLDLAAADELQHVLIVEMLIEPASVADEFDPHQVLADQTVPQYFAVGEDEVPVVAEVVVLVTIAVDEVKHDKGVDRRFDGLLVVS